MGTLHLQLVSEMGWPKPSPQETVGVTTVVDRTSVDGAVLFGQYSRAVSVFSRLSDVDNAVPIRRRHATPMSGIDFVTTFISRPPDLRLTRMKSIIATIRIRMKKIVLINANKT